MRRIFLRVNPIQKTFELFSADGSSSASIAVTALNERDVCRSLAREKCDKLLRKLADSLALEKKGGWEIHRKNDSAPELYQSGRCSEFNISVSHCGQWAAVGIAKGMAIGVDIQQHQELRRRREMAEMIGLDVSTVNSEQQFFSSWTLREAITKATGGSLLVAHPIEVDLSAACKHPGRAVSAEQYTALVERMVPDAHLAVVLDQGNSGS